ncbi:MAG TPA: RNA methyltransferase [Humisphaera sp.]|nr:RNA methyltransferase [Humisphaera sp.]
MNPIPITSLDDPRVAAYRNLKEKELDRAGRLFIAEGEYVVRRLLESDYPVESVFASDLRLPKIAGFVPEGVPLYVTPQQTMNGLMGARFQSGIVACGRRKPWRPMEQVIPNTPGRLTLVVCPDISNVQNIGAIIRIAAGFGADAMVLGEQCHDPFWRQAIRVSMGTIFRLPIHQSRNLVEDMQRLKTEWKVELAASVLSDSAEPLSQSRRPDRFGILFGNEAQGIGEQYVRASDRQITIPMNPGIDSLNVAIAAGIVLYHFTRQDSFVASPGV